MSRTSTGVHFYLKSPGDKVSAIKANFCYASQQFDYYEPKLAVETAYWNKKTQRAKENKSYPEFFDLNATLDNIAATILSCYRRYINDHARIPEKEELREAVQRRRGIIKPEKPKPELFEFIQQFIKDIEDGKHLNLITGRPVSATTMRSYKQTELLMKSYCAAKKCTLKYESINPEFHRDFVHYLSHEYKSPTNDKSFKPNTVGKHITNIKSFMSYAVDRKMTTASDHKMKGFRVIKEEVDSVFLDQEEITALENHPLPFKSREDMIRDLFIIGCHTALRISDLKRLSPQHLKNVNGERYIEIEMQKTSKPVTIPINEKLEKLFLKYQTPSGEYFPGIYEQDVNDVIKEITAEIKIFQKEVMINSTENNIRVSKLIPKSQLITNHTVRRSFATNKVLEGYPFAAIMLITGHKTEKAFLRYVKLSGYHAIKMFKQHKDKLGKVA